MMAKLKVAVAVSGGVDSTAATILLKRRGFDLIGVFMNNWSEDERHSNCSVDENREDAKLVCRRLDVPFKELNFSKTYWNHVFCYLVDGYKKGETPNPDVMCNKFVKFGSFLKYAMETLKVDAIATGHYAGSSFGPFWELRDKHDRSGVKLYRARDINKDQTLFLSQITQESLKRVMFPLQYLLKSEVKKIAADFGFESIAKKKESTGICFIGKRNFKSFIEEFIESKPGKFIDIETNQVIGEHKGIHQWIIGENCKIGGLKCKHYIVKKDVLTNNIFVASNKHYLLYGNMIITRTPHWICEEPEELINGEQLNCLFKFQHVEQPEKCVVRKLQSNELLIQLFQPKIALTTGQFAVLYRNEECLGSAAISKHWS